MERNFFMINRRDLVANAGSKVIHPTRLPPPEEVSVIVNNTDWKEALGELHKVAESFSAMATTLHADEDRSWLNKIINWLKL